MARDLFRLQADEYAAVQARLAKFEAKLMKWHRGDDISRRIATIPGIGPIGSSMLSMKAPQRLEILVLRSTLIVGATNGCMPGLWPPDAMRICSRRGT